MILKNFFSKECLKNFCLVKLHWIQQYLINFHVKKFSETYEFVVIFCGFVKVQVCQKVSDNFLRRHFFGKGIFRTPLIFIHRIDVCKRFNKCYCFVKVEAVRGIFLNILIQQHLSFIHGTLKVSLNFYAANRYGKLKKLQKLLFR